MWTPSSNEQAIRAYTRTLRRLPRSVFLDVSGRPHQMNHGHRCLLGWAMRASMAEAAGLSDASQIKSRNGDWLAPTLYLQSRFGGTLADWSDIYCGVTDDDERELIERAWVRRMNELVRVRSNKQVVEEVLKEVSAKVEERDHATVS